MVIWAGFGLIVGFLCADGTIRGLLGHFGERAASWMAVGGYTVCTAYYCLAYETDAGDYVLLIYIRLFLVGIAVGLFSLDWGGKRPHVTEAPISRALDNWFTRRRAGCARHRARTPMDGASHVRHHYRDTGHSTSSPSGPLPPRNLGARAASRHHDFLEGAVEA
ncbi:hypothetical protein [Streptomyces collinus]|uniref:hypothetical protein n=1 Tax=Streptomyces collinus TaxID=42684 RepID=UPI0036E0EFDA